MSKKWHQPLGHVFSKAFSFFSKKVTFCKTCPKIDENVPDLIDFGRVLGHIKLQNCLKKGQKLHLVTLFFEQNVT